MLIDTKSFFKHENWSFQQWVQPLKSGRQLWQKKISKFFISLFSIDFLTITLSNRRKIDWKC